MIVAKNFRIEETKDAVQAKFDISGPGFPSSFSFNVHPANADAIEIEEPNWAAISLIFQAMLMGQDLTIEADLSPILVNNLQNDLQAMLHNFEPRANKINFSSGQTAQPAYRHQNKDVATGFSGGVDSFATFTIYSKPELVRGTKISALSIYHVGALGDTAPGNAQLMADAYKRCKDFADKKNLKVFSVEADMNALFGVASKFGPTRFTKTVGLRNAACALLFQKEIGTYLPSPARGYEEGTFGPAKSTEYVDPVLQPLFTTEGLRFQSGAAGLSRTRKTALIAENEDAHHYLNVCAGDMNLRYQPTHINCTRCGKCALTLRDLEAAGHVDKFHRVFDLDYYYAHRAEIMETARKTYKGARKKMPIRLYWGDIVSMLKSK